ncbi:hypothetical protein CDAR_513001 [Caerostris darwini]|uniref:Uncharacterized protein n=1 Tax=Caerostris darwini TaxID=1538125 RepID=A0AAV4S2L8_9ARAC|nr:hypothetical protein CDAR_513001 [Caerostris darwini]
MFHSGFCFLSGTNDTREAHSCRGRGCSSTRTRGTYRREQLFSCTGGSIILFSAGSSCSEKMLAGAGFAQQAEERKGFSLFLQLHTILHLRIRCRRNVLLTALSEWNKSTFD